jgi:riboflavin synthase
VFTGIIRQIGCVTDVVVTSGGKRITVDVGPIADEASHGASICVNGVCLTVSGIRGPRVEFDVIRETLDRTTLGHLRASEKVNLEASLRAGDAIDGHFVQGHVDGTAKVARKTATPAEHVFWFTPEEAIAAYIIAKGSVAIDGVSLTIAAVDQGQFSVALIPTTLDMTTLGTLSIGDRVNIETDIISRTVVSHLRSIGRDGGISLEQLRAQGFA